VDTHIDELNKNNSYNYYYNYYNYWTQKLFPVIDIYLIYKHLPLKYAKTLFNIKYYFHIQTDTNITADVSQANWWISKQLNSKHMTTYDYIDANSVDAKHNYHRIEWIEG
jgi:hypothetical protein